MSVIVTGIDMPKNCKECELTFLDTGDDAYFGTNCNRCIYDYAEICHDDKRWDDCPLRSVEGLIEKIEERRSKQNCSCSDCIDIIREYCGEV